MQRYDYLILGSGIGGLSFALQAAKRGTVAVVTKKSDSESNTNYAQGGIASVLAPDDTFEAHISDTLCAGAGLCDPEVVNRVVRDGPDRIRQLIGWGVEFSRSDRGDPGFDLGREGGHSARRIVHAKDMTGRAVERALLDRARQAASIHFYENHFAADLVVTGKGANRRCVGAHVLSPGGRATAILAPTTCLATGGTGKVYLYTSNPDIASGDGIAMAYRAGARVANLEFMQFHPTCLYHPQAKNFLISEAVRGEGAVLRLRDGEPFMEAYHPSGCLAPRDVVARAIDHEMKRRGDEFVFLDITHRDADFLRNRFPGIYETCRGYGIDLTREPVPVVPAAHYLCGGVQVDEAGRTSLPGLYAVGEVSCTGLHGANRLASNSLLEALVYARAAADDSSNLTRDFPAVPADVPPWSGAGGVPSDEDVVVAQDWDELRRLMWNYVGIVRTDRRLARARRRVALLREEILDHFRRFAPSPDLLELRNLAQVADLMIRSATIRKESRGLHFNVDHPEPDDKTWKRDTVIRKIR